MVSLACLASAIGIVLTKKISKQTEETVITFYLGVASVVCGLIGLFSAGNPSNPPVWEWFLSLGRYCPQTPAIPPSGSGSSP